MKYLFFIFVFPFFLFSSNITSLYKSLDPYSISQLFAFYELYPETPEGKEALKKASKLLSSDNLSLSLFSSLDIRFLISVVNRQLFEKPKKFKEEDLQLIRKISKRLSNRKLKGFNKWTEKEILELPAEEIDLTRALFIAQFGNEDKKLIQYYEASLDLMALQILCRLSATASNEEKVHAINNFIFFEMGFRFPPHTLYAKDIDIYTFLPSVIDNRRGVCLGVSLLYLCLAQRIDLPLEIITPPGHIYLRYRKDDGTLINIETTARGIDLPSKNYLGIETKKLQQRNVKEAVGLAFINQAAICWGKKEFKVAVDLYEKAKIYLPEDILVKELLGYSYLFINNKSKGEALLKQIKDKIPEHGVTKNTIIEDYFNKKTNAKGIEAIFLSVDENKKSIVDKQKILENILKKFPKFRAGLIQLANTHMQLGRIKKALDILEKHINIDPNNPLVNYYLSSLYFERLDYNKSWEYYNRSKSYLHKQDHHPQALKELYLNLRSTCPCP